jgi:hypothetical protein
MKNHNYVIYMGKSSEERWHYGTFAFLTPEETIISNGIRAYRVVSRNGESVSDLLIKTIEDWKLHRPRDSYTRYITTHPEVSNFLQLKLSKSKSEIWCFTSDDFQKNYVHNYHKNPSSSTFLLNPSHTIPVKLSRVSLKYVETLKTFLSVTDFS